MDFTGFVISTDPPYYDNVPYADLSDFFYVWLKRSLGTLYPTLFQTMLVPKSEELVADYKRHNGKDVADEFFLNGMMNVMRHMATQGRKDFPATIYYAFRQGEADEEGVASKGWSTFLQAVIGAGYQVGATWPVRTESVIGLKKNKNALATSVVLSCRPRTVGAVTVSRSEFIRSLKRELPEAMREMHRGSIAPVDIPQASIGPGIGIFSRYEAVIESDDSHMSVWSALQIINHALDEFLAEQEGDFDPATRFCLTWFTQNGYDKGPFGDADNLARARGISVDSVKQAGIIESSAGKVRIFRRHELQKDWEPSTDTPPTVWECCQYLARTLENEGEAAAALLMKKLGSDRAEAAKDLAYHVHKWSDAKEATAYNALIAVWADLTRIAATIQDNRGDDQSSLEL